MWKIIGKHLTSKGSEALWTGLAIARRRLGRYIHLRTHS